MKTFNAGNFEDIFCDEIPMLNELKESDISFYICGGFVRDTLSYNEWDVKDNSFHFKNPKRRLYKKDPANSTNELDLLIEGDIDIYFKSEEDFDKFCDEISPKYEKDKKDQRKRFSTTYKTPENVREIDVTFYNFANIDDIISEFDISNCAVGYDPETNEFHSFFHKFRDYPKRFYFLLDPSEGAYTFFRSLKLLTKGYRPKKVTADMLYHIIFPYNRRINKQHFLSYYANPNWHSGKTQRGINRKIDRQTMSNIEEFVSAYTGAVRSSYKDVTDDQIKKIRSSLNEQLFNNNTMPPNYKLGMKELIATLDQSCKNVIESKKEQQEYGDYERRKERTYH